MAGCGVVDAPDMVTEYVFGWVGEEQSVGGKRLAFYWIESLCERIKGRDRLEGIRMAEEVDLIALDNDEFGMRRYVEVGDLAACCGEHDGLDGWIIC